MTTQEDRADFELKISMEYEQPPCIDRDGDGYADGYVDNAWWGYQAALAHERQLKPVGDLIRRSDVIEMLDNLGFIKDADYNNVRMFLVDDGYHSINTIPAISNTVEPVANIKRDFRGNGYAELLPNARFVFSPTITEYEPIKLYTQPQSVKDALEEAALVCDATDIVTYTFAGQLYDSGAETLGKAIDAIRKLKDET